MTEPISPKAPSPNPPAPRPCRGAAPRASPPLLRRLQPWVDLLYKLLAAAVAALALWKGLG